MSTAEVDTEKGSTTVIESSDSQKTISSRRMSKEDQAIVEVERDAPEVQQDEVPLYNPHIDVSGVDEKALLRKMDWQLVPWLSFLFLLSFLDRTSVGNAKLYGIEQALHINDTQYLIALTVFFIPYAFFEVPSNIVLKRLKPSFWLSFLMLGWGVIMTIQGLVHNYGGLLIIRWLLGAFEAGLFPGVTYYLSCWYKRQEFGFRTAVFFSAATIAGAFGGLLAAGLSQLAGVGGKGGWAWIFIIEGLVTIVAGVLSFFIIQDFPDTARFLTEEERTFVVRRLQADGQVSATGEKLKWQYVWQALIDWKTWLGMALYMGNEGPLYAIALFMPSIIDQLGYSATPANLLTVPVYVLACFVTCLVSWLADRYGGRGWWNIGCMLVGGTGFIILIASRNAALSYFGVYLAACGVYPCVPNVIAWMSNNLEGSYKRAVSLGMIISWGNLNGAVSSNVYRAQDAPWYTLGHGILLIYIGISLICSTTFIILFARENRKRERGERDEVIKGVNEDRDDLVCNGVFASVEEARREKGDTWSGFRYRW
ncbi:MFS general substrate transporter [Rhodofomes roseus]|uniref:MFS general substrate transporter n=1 Tax=Rhodofomes roseus TaxID=34475 RepID=A0ABQ8K682_9APHY|nr:MFS general substrate transporter [Rhodofomes roseus]KAH9832608.1 MFS general substrate transporter [Rhodofomes roseus]